MTMNRFFTIVFGALTAICLVAAFVAGRADYIIIAAMCAAVHVAGRVEEAKERERR